MRDLHNKCLVLECHLSKEGRVCVRVAYFMACKVIAVGEVAFEGTKSRLVGERYPHDYWPRYVESIGGTLAGLLYRTEEVSWWKSNGLATCSWSSGPQTLQ